MGCVYDDPRSGGTIWSIRYKDVDGSVHRERTGAENKTLARRILAERENAVERAKLLGLKNVGALITPPPPVTLRAFATEYLDHVDAALKPQTAETYHGIMRNHLLPALGSMTLREMKPGCVQQFADQRLAAGAAPSSVCQALSVLSGLFREALKREIVDRNPVRMIKKPKVENVIVRFLDNEEEKRLLAFAPEPIRTMIVVAVHSGLRTSEERSLTWADVRFEERHVVVRGTKSKKDRVVPMNNTLYNTLQSIPRHLGSAFVFTNPGTETRYDRFNNTTWKRILLLAGIQNFRWHDLRHTFGSRLAQAGVPIVTIKELMGHSSIQVTMRYAHLQPSNLRDAVFVLDRPAAGHRRPAGSTHRSTHGGSPAESGAPKSAQVLAR